MEYNNQYTINNVLTLNEWMHATFVSKMLYTSMSGRKPKLYIEINNDISIIEDPKDLMSWFNKNNILDSDQEIIRNYQFELEKDATFNINGVNKSIRITVI